MNFFGKSNTYFKGAVENEPSCPYGLKDLQRKYVEFCRSPLVKEVDSARDFLSLCSLDSVSRIGLVHQNGAVCLLITTKTIILENHCSGFFHEIGEMIIVMRRHPNSEVFFFNRTGVARRVMSDNVYISHHPHVNENGVICSDVRDRLLQEAGAGRVLRACRLALNAINTYGPDRPICDITYWPRWNPEGRK